MRLCFALAVLVPILAFAQDIPAIAPTVSSENAEVFRNVVISGGKSLLLESSIDFANASAVAVTLVCTTCTSNATSLASAGLVLQARWVIPNAELVVPTETKNATSFTFYDAGSASFAVFGSQFRLMLHNRGSQGVLIQQITFFRRAGP